MSHLRNGPVDSSCSRAGHRASRDIREREHLRALYVFFSSRQEPCQRRPKIDPFSTVEN